MPANYQTEDELLQQLKQATRERYTKVGAPQIELDEWLSLCKYRSYKRGDIIQSSEILHIAGGYALMLDDREEIGLVHALPGDDIGILNIMCERYREKWGKSLPRTNALIGTFKALTKVEALEFPTDNIRTLLNKNGWFRDYNELKHAGEFRRLEMTAKVRSWNYAPDLVRACIHFLGETQGSASNMCELEIPRRVTNWEFACLTGIRRLGDIGEQLKLLENMGVASRTNNNLRIYKMDCLLYGCKDIGLCAIA